MTGSGGRETISPGMTSQQPHVGTGQAVFGQPADSLEQRRPKLVIQELEGSFIPLASPAMPLGGYRHRPAAGWRRHCAWSMLKHPERLQDTSARAGAGIYSDVRTAVCMHRLPHISQGEQPCRDPCG